MGGRERGRQGLQATISGVHQWREERGGSNGCSNLHSHRETDGNEGPLTRLEERTGHGWRGRFPGIARWAARLGVCGCKVTGARRWRCSRTWRRRGSRQARRRRGGVGSRGHRG
jgi:hypothetical protein